MNIAYKISAESTKRLPILNFEATSDKEYYISDYSIAIHRLEHSPSHYELTSLDIVDDNILYVVADGKIESKYELPATTANCSMCGEELEAVERFMPNPFRGAPTRGSSHICPRCYERATDESIKEYYYKPRPVFYGDDKFFVGLEIETEHERVTTYDDEYDEDELDHSVIEDAARVTGNKFAYCKHDGSISFGFETVTHPFTLDYEREHHKLEETLATLENEGMGGMEKGYQTVGIHIHISKQAFTVGSLYKTVKFFSENSEFISKIANREPNGYCSYNMFRSPERALSAVLEGGMFGHHSAISSSKSTIEFRIFNSTTDYDTVLSYIQFVYSIVEFMNNVAIQDVKLSSFKRYVRRTEYKELINVINKLTIEEVA